MPGPARDLDLLCPEFKRRLHRVRSTGRAAGPTCSRALGSAAAARQKPGMSDDLSDDQRVRIPDGYAPLDWFEGFGRQIGPLYERHDGSGSYVRAFRVAAHHCNGMRNAHGGMLMSFADMALGHAVSVERSHWWVTVRLACDFVSGAHLGEWVEGNGRVVGEVDDVYTVEGRVWTGTRTLMVCTGLFKAIEKRPPRPGERAWTP